MQPQLYRKGSETATTIHLYKQNRRLTVVKEPGIEQLPGSLLLCALKCVSYDKGLTNNSHKKGLFHKFLQNAFKYVIYAGNLLISLVFIHIHIGKSNLIQEKIEKILHIS